MTCSRFEQCVVVNNYKCINHCNIDCLISKNNAEHINCTENSKSYFLNNKAGEIVANYHVDGGIVKTNAIVRCDYLVIIYSKILRAIFVELKGKDVKHAYEQIYESMNLLHNHIPNYNQAKFYARIVSNGGVPKDNLKPYIKRLKQLMIRLNHDDIERIKISKLIMREDVKDFI